jgi:hypothetical protein
MLIDGIYSSILIQLKQFGSASVENEHKIPIKYLSAYVRVCLFDQNVAQGSIHELLRTGVKPLI